jgi:hypothetical protein
MWILRFLPDWIFYAMLLAGIAGSVAAWFLSFVPFIRTYKLFIQIASYVLIGIGLYMSGAISNENTWKARVDELNLKIAEAQAQSSEENVKIIEKVITKTKVIYQKNENVKAFIETELVKHDDKFAPGMECAIPSEFYKSLNDAAETVK